MAKNRKLKTTGTCAKCRGPIAPGDLVHEERILFHRGCSGFGMMPMAETVETARLRALMAFEDAIKVHVEEIKDPEVLEEVRKSWNRYELCKDRVMLGAGSKNEEMQALRLALNEQIKIVFR